MKFLTVLSMFLFMISCSSVARSVGRSLPKKLEDAKVYQVEDSVFNQIRKQVKATNDFLVNNTLNLDIRYSYLNRKINESVKPKGKLKNFFATAEEELDTSKTAKEVLWLSDPKLSQSTDRGNHIRLQLNYFMKKLLLDAGILSLPIEKYGRMEFQFSPEIKQNKLFLNARFEKAEGDFLTYVSGVAFKTFINLFLDQLNDVEIPPEFLQSTGITVDGSPLKIGYKVYNLSATIHKIDSVSMKYVINSDFSLFFNEEGKVLESENKPTLSLDLNVLQSAVDTIMAQQGGKILVKGDPNTGDYFQFDNITVKSDSGRLVLNTKYSGKLPLTVFEYGLDGELDIEVTPLILNNRLYLKFDRFIFYGPEKDTDMLSDLLNILITNTIQKSLYIDLNGYLPTYDQEFQVNAEVMLKNVQAVFTKGELVGDQIQIYSKLSALIILN